MVYVNVAELSEVIFLITRHIQWELILLNSAFFPYELIPKFIWQSTWTNGYKPDRTAPRSLAGCALWCHNGLCPKGNERYSGRRWRLFPWGPLGEMYRSDRSPCGHIGSLGSGLVLIWGIVRSWSLRSRAVLFFWIMVLIYTRSLLVPLMELNSTMHGYDGKRRSLNFFLNMLMHS